MCVLIPVGGRITQKCVALSVFLINEPLVTLKGLEVRRVICFVARTNVFETVKLFRFLYPGATDLITEAEVFPLLYLGKKYTVRSLIRVVLNHLEGCITSYNVGQIVLAGQDFFDDAPPK